MANTHIDGHGVAATDSTTDQNKNTNYFQRLPVELVASIARHVDDDHHDLCGCKQKDAAVHVMRLTCKYLYDSCQDQWAHLHLRSLRLRLNREAIEHISSILAPAGLIGRVRHLTLLGPPTARRDLHTLAPAQVDSFYVLLRAFAQQLSGLESITIKDTQFLHHNVPPSCEAALALRALTEANLPGVNEIRIITGNFTSGLIASVLNT